MTEHHEHPTLRSVSLRVHLGRRQHWWSVTLRTQRGQYVHDRHIHSGPVALPPAGSDFMDVVVLLELALQAMREAQEARDRAERPGAPGGGGGDTRPLHVVRDPDGA